MLNFIVIHVQLCKIFKITRVSCLAHIVCCDVNIVDTALTEKQYFVDRVVIYVA